MYEKFLADEYADKMAEDTETNTKTKLERKTDIDKTQGYIGKIDLARKVFEKLYKS